MSSRYAIIEYRLHQCCKHGDSNNIEFVEGKEWRYARKMVEECKLGLHDEFDSYGLRYGWIERVERWIVNGVYDGDQDYEILWEREVIE